MHSGRYFEQFSCMFSGKKQCFGLEIFLNFKMSLAIFFKETGNFCINWQLC